MTCVSLAVLGLMMSTFLDALKRIVLGVILIACVSGIILLSDLKSRVDAGAYTGKTRVALVQFASQPIIGLARDGLVTALKERGYAKDENILLTEYNAEQDVTTANAIAREVTSGSQDVVITFTTVSLQTVANANNLGKKIPHIYGLVSNPPGAGVGIDPKDLSKHPPHLVGYGTMQPIQDAFDLIREMNPQVKRVGLVWNAAEINSVNQTKVARLVTAAMGIELIEATVENSTSVAEGASSLLARGADAIWISGDVTVLVAADAVCDIAKRGRIPVISVIPTTVKKGALLDIGGDYYTVGHAVGMRAADILDGHKPSDFDATAYVPKVIHINKTRLLGLKGNWRIPKSVEARASLVIDATGEHTIKKDQHLPMDATAPATWKVNSDKGKATQQSNRQNPTMLPLEMHGFNTRVIC